MKIFYGICGEGLGHAARASAIIEKLDHEVHIFTWGEAYNFFKKQNYSYLHDIPGISFGRGKNNKIKILPSIFNLIVFLLTDKQDDILNEYIRHTPDLFITDYEPMMPRIASIVKRPCVSIDNQHKFNCDFKLPFNLMIYKKLIGLFNNILVPKVDKVIVSTFHYNYISSEYLLVNSLIRDYLEKLPVTLGDYVLVYYKKSYGEKILDLLAKTDEKVKVYNAPEDLRKYSNMEYFPLENEKFLEDLAGCKCVISTAGNQLIGESVYCGKPYLAIPEDNQPEQLINAYCLKHYMGCGDWCHSKNLNSKVINDFLSNKYMASKNLNGLNQVVNVINNYNERNR